MMLRLLRLFALPAIFIMGIVHAYAEKPIRHQPSSPPLDWAPPRPTPAYDWRHTTSWGIAGGTASGSGLSLRLWEESLGWQFTFLPVYYNTEDFLFIAGLERMRTLGKAPAQAPGPWGFATLHWYLFASTYHSVISDEGDPDYMGSAGAGLGLELNRRASRFSMQLGVGPYMAVQSSKSLEFYVMPLLEFSWHFGSPRAILP